MFGLRAAFTPYIIGGVVVALMASHAWMYFKGRSGANARWELAMAKQATEAATVMANALAINAAIDAASYESAKRMDAEHDRTVREIEIAADTAERGYADRLRRIAASRPRCDNAAPAETSNPGSDTESAAVRRDRLLGEVAAGFREIGAGAESLKATVKTCVEWAREVGR